MRRGVLQYLACPRCDGDLALLEPVEGSQGHVERGVLRCRRCEDVYPVRDGIPRFPVASAAAAPTTLRTQETYDFTWQRVGRREVLEAWEKDSHRYLALIPRELVSGPGRVGLEAGCGGGADLLRLAGGGAEIVAFDVSAGVESAFSLTRHLPNVHVVQADLHRPPFRPGIFDFAYSFGVLHHLPEPLRGVQSLARLLKPGAPLITYLYEDFGERTALERVALGLVRAARGLTSRLPAPVLYALCWGAVPVVWLTLAAPAALARRARLPVAERIPFRHTLRWPVLAADLFDRFAPPREWRYSRDDVARLYHEAGLAAVEIRHYRGWVSWGFKRAVAPRGEHVQGPVLGRLARG